MSLAQVRWHSPSTLAGLAPAQSGGDYPDVPESWNIFSIGRSPQDEDQLTEMLVWLVTAVPEVGSRIADLAFGFEPDPADLDVRT